jgi:hypothetical protein
VAAKRKPLDAFSPFVRTSMRTAEAEARRKGSFSGLGALPSFHWVIRFGLRRRRIDPLRLVFSIGDESILGIPAAPVVHSDRLSLPAVEKNWMNRVVSGSSGLLEIRDAA